MQKESTTTYMVSFEAGPGFITVEANDDGLTGISFRKTKGKRQNEFIRKVKTDIQKYLSGEQVSFNYRLNLSWLTPHQRKVFQWLRKVPYGNTISYKELAKRVKTGPRAVGRILGSNPFPIVVPCHRVINSSGALGGFSGGLAWKRYLLKIEGVI